MAFKGGEFMYIRHNIAAMNTTRQLGLANKNVSKHTERLATSFKVNRAGDDAAGLSISEKMRAQISGLSKASKNAQDGISLIQTAEGALSEVHTMLFRGRELAVQAANDTNTDEDRQQLQQELTQLFDEIDRIGQDTEFNTMKLFDSGPKQLKFQVGSNENQTINVILQELSINSLGLISTTIHNQLNANDAIQRFDESITSISDQRSHLGAWQNRLEHIIQGNNNTSLNTQSANSTIRDSNMAYESMNLVKNDILAQTMNSVMAHSKLKNDWILNILN